MNGSARTPGPLALAFLLAGAAALPPARAEDPPAPPAPPPPAPAAPAPKAPPPDADLDPEPQILKESRSDPRNRKPDAFPVLRSPAFAGALEARNMDSGEWVIGAVVGKTPLAFPVNVMNRHEILVGESDGVPYLVCWCPLCRTGTVHARTLEGQVLDFGHSGMLYRGAFLLYDAGTRSLWHNAEGRALTGKLRGRRLERIPSLFVPWEVWRKAYPATRVIAKDPLDLDQTVDPFERRDRLLKLQHGLGIAAGGEDRLYELSQLERMPLVQEGVGGVPVVVCYQPATRTAAAWERTVEGRVLDLRRAEDGENGLPRLEETGEDRSVFDAVTGQCLTGPLRGKALKPVPSCFWEVYAWTAHHPRGTMFRASVPPPVDLPDVPK